MTMQSKVHSDHTVVPLHDCITRCEYPQCSASMKEVSKGLQAVFHIASVFMHSVELYHFYRKTRINASLLQVA